MSLRTRVAATPIRMFGRGRVYALAAPVPERTALADDLKLFVTTFAGGFLFMAVYLN